MSRYRSETTGLESKAQLKSVRISVYSGLCKKADVFFENQHKWTDHEKVIADSAWKTADEKYEGAKTGLLSELKQLDSSSLSRYFSEIGVDMPKNVDEWLAPSPA